MAMARIFNYYKFSRSDMYLIRYCFILTCALLMFVPVSANKNAVNSEVIKDLSVDEMLDHAKRCSDLGLQTEETQVLERLKDSGFSMTTGQKSKCLYRLALAYYTMGSYQLSLNNLFELLRLEKPDSLKFYDISARTILAGTYMRFGSTAQADSVLRNCERELKRYKFSASRQRNLWRDYYLEKSTICAERDEWPEYFALLKESDKYSDESPENDIRRKLDYGIYYMKTGRSDLAEQYFRTIMEDKDWSYNKLAAMVNYSQMLYNEKRFDDAFRISNLSLDMLAGHKMDQMKATILLVKGLSLHNSGKSADAIPLLEESRMIRDSIFEWHTAHSVLGLAKDFERELDSANLDNIRRANQRSWIINAILIISLIAAIGVIFLILKRVRLLKRRNEHLSSELSEIEVRHAENIQETLTDLSDNKRRMVALTLKLGQLNDLVRSAIDRNQNTLDSDRINALRDGMKSLDMNKNVWEIFDILCRQTDPKFYENLTRLHPDLTKGEKRMCAYIKMELSTKEIAAITVRSARTVETIRYRLRKKLGLPDDISTEYYLRHSV